MNVKIQEIPGNLSSLINGFLDLDEHELVWVLIPEHTVQLL